MNDSYREQRPLLCDDRSDEEFDVKNYNYQRRNRHSICSGRARNYAKGAAAVITRWPDNCSTSVAYWWLGISMIALTILVIYNSVLIFGMIPTPEMKLHKYRIFNNEMKPKVQTSVIDVYMHLIINNGSDGLLNKYLPYIAGISKKYPSFKYKFLAVLNDTLKDYRDYKDEERNEIAFNSLWSNKKLNGKMSSRYNISIEYISLTDYLNDSPIRKFWRHLPPHLIEFLVRSVSIWEKGGIAFNPKILSPKLNNSHYIEKLYDIFNIYSNSSSVSTERKIQFKQEADVNTKRPNNIQDIINNLVKYDNNILNTDLSEAENNNVGVISNIENIAKSKRAAKYESSLDDIINGNIEQSNLHANNKILNEINNKPNSTKSTEFNSGIIPLFLKYLFQNKTDTPRTHHETNNNKSLLNNFTTFSQNQSLPVENIILIPSKERNEYSDTSKISKKNYLENRTENVPFMETNLNQNIPNLSMDIKGNIIATKMACHAFLGTMFSNVIQHTEDETLTDFIISELSLFCNGMLSSCTGVNVILV